MFTSPTVSNSNEALQRIEFFKAPLDLSTWQVSINRREGNIYKSIHLRPSPLTTNGSSNKGRAIWLSVNYMWRHLPSDSSQYTCQYTRQKEATLKQGPPGYMVLGQLYEDACTPTAVNIHVKSVQRAFTISMLN